jgi:hypothetical protein
MRVGDSFDIDGAKHLLDLPPLTGMHASATQHGLRGAQGSAAVSTGWSVERSKVVIEGVDIRFAESGDSLVLRENRAKLTLSQISFSSTTQRQGISELIVV